MPNSGFWMSSFHSDSMVSCPLLDACQGDRQALQDWLNTTNRYKEQQVTLAMFLDLAPDSAGTVHVRHAYLPMLGHALVCTTSCTMQAVKVVMHGWPWYAGQELGVLHSRLLAKHLLANAMQ